MALAAIVYSSDEYIYCIYHACIKKAIHMRAHTLKHTQYFADTLLLTNCLHTSLGAKALSQIIQHFSHREHLHNSLPAGATLKVSFLLTTLSWTHTYTCAHTHSWTLTPAYTCRLCAHRWSNYRHFNHWTLLLWGTADIAGSGQKKRPLTDFNLGLMIVVWAWMLCCS